MNNKGSLLKPTNSHNNIKERIKPDAYVDKEQHKTIQSVASSTVAITKQSHNGLKALKTIMGESTYDRLIHDLIQTKLDTLNEKEQNLYKLLVSNNSR